MYPKKVRACSSVYSHRRARNFSTMQDLLAARIKKDISKSVDQNNPELKLYLEQEIKNMMQNKQLTESRLKTAKRRLLSMLNNKVKSETRNNVSKNSLDVLQKERVPALNMTVTNNKMLPDIKNNPNWVDLIKFDVAMYEEEQRRIKLQESEKKKRNYMELHKQLMESQKKKEIEKNKDVSEFKRQLVLIEKEETQQKEKDDAFRNKIIEEKRSRDQQLKEAEEKKKKVKVESLSNEKKLLERLQSEIKQEEQTAKDKKEKDLKAFSRILKENELFKERVKERKLKEKKDDAVALEEYTKFLEIEDNKRRNELKVREERLQKFMNIAEETVGKQEKQKLKEEELQHLKYINEKEKKEEEIEKKKKLMKLNKERALIQGMQRQVEEKNHVKQSERSQDMQYLQEWIKSTDKIFNEDKKRWELNIKKEKDNQLLIKQQIEARNKDSFNKMSIREIQLNKELVNKIGNSTSYTASQ